MLHDRGVLDIKDWNGVLNGQVAVKKARRNSLRAYFDPNNPVVLNNLELLNSSYR